ncbi:MAG TPA: ATP synthase F0 subunit B, partial [Pyrinomonadaceae bacterium]|nr:ATP synthase F0 subunit B [Pyrinomonadaceae bacterium]
AVVVMVAILNRTMFRPINKILADREAQTAGRSSEAKKLRADVEDSISRYETGLRQARTAGYQLVESKRNEALKYREEEVNKVREEIRVLIASEKAQIEQQVAEARLSLQAEATETAREIGSRILHRSVS